METAPETQETVSNDEVYEENVQQENVTAEETVEPSNEEAKSNNRKDDRGGFIHGLSVGLGIGCIATFVIVWVSVFFTPMLPSAITYENLLTIFVYPLIYLLAVGLIALTAGIVREYYARHD